jgi:hypothetical protein
MPATEAISPTLDAIDQVKMALMVGISQRIIANYGNFYQAVIATNVPYHRLKLLKWGYVGEFSLPWLIRFADQLGAKITITIE